MIIRILCFLLVVFSLPLSANNSFADYFEYYPSFIPEHANEITQHFTENSTISSKKRLALFKQINDALSTQIKQKPDNPLLWFIKGLNFKNRLDALEEQKVLGASNIDPLIKKTKDYFQRSFVKAMHLDDKKKANLTARMYATMKHYLKDNERILALQKELKQGGSGDNETHYWFTHWDVIGSLQDMGRLDDAEIALYQLKNELKIAGLENSVFNEVYQQAKNELVKEHILSTELEKEITKKALPKSLKNKPAKKLALESIKNTFKTYWLMILINIFVVISLVFAFLKREKD